MIFNKAPKWYQVRRNKIVVGSILIIFFLSLTLFFVAIYFATTSGELLNIKTGPVKYPLYAYAKCWIILADDCLCHENDHLNNLLGHRNSMKEQVPGWKVDVEYVQLSDVEYAQLSEHASDKDYFRNCGKGEKWFGYGGYSGGSINTTLFGCGNATLDFGNCLDRGEVLAFLNGKELGSVNGLKNKTIDFGYLDGDSIEIRENGGIILLNSFVQDPCPGKFKIFIHTL